MLQCISCIYVFCIENIYDILRLFYHCSTDVKIALFRSYCICFYCPFLWTHSKKSSHSKLRVAFNNVYRRILKLPPLIISSASTVHAINNIDSFEVLIRKRIFGFTERLINCENTIIKCFNNSWVLRFDIWSPWNELLFIYIYIFYVLYYYILSLLYMFYLRPEIQ